MDALFPYARDSLAYPDLLAEGLLPHKVKEVWMWTIADNINHRNDITDTFSLKVKALRCHESQHRDPDATERWVCQWWGQIAVEAGLPDGSFAERFFVADAR